MPGLRLSGLRLSGLRLMVSGLVAALVAGLAVAVVSPLGSGPAVAAAEGASLGGAVLASPAVVGGSAVEGLDFADPGAGVSVMAPPVASSTGAAQASYPLVVPAGRGGVGPSLGLAYDSRGAGAGSGWLGAGWSLSGVGEVSVDTAFGVPLFCPRVSGPVCANVESESYRFAGEYTDPRGLADLGQRWYDPRHQLFYSPDPATTDDPTNLISDPKLTNSYTLNHHNTYRYTDPDGRKPRPTKPDVRGLAQLVGKTRAPAFSIQPPPRRFTGPVERFDETTTTTTTATTTTATTTPTSTTATTAPGTYFVSRWDPTWKSPPKGYIGAVIIGDPATDEGVPEMYRNVWTPEFAIERRNFWMDSLLAYDNPYQRMVMTAKINEIQRALDEWNEGYGRDYLTSSEEQ